MLIRKKPHLIVSTEATGIRVVRFTHPDLRTQLDAVGEIETCLLFQELQERVLNELAEGELLVFNFGLVEWFPTPFYRLLLKVRQVVLARKARLVLCRADANIQEGFDLFGASRLFTITATEAGAIHEVGVGRKGNAECTRYNTRGESR
jgi:anti-anti-sigma regulatory factor